MLVSFPAVAMPASAGNRVFVYNILHKVSNYNVGTMRRLEDIAEGWLVLRYLMAWDANETTSMSS